MKLPSLMGDWFHYFVNIICNLTCELCNSQKWTKTLENI